MIPDEQEQTWGEMASWALADASEELEDNNDPRVNLEIAQTAALVSIALSLERITNLKPAPPAAT